HELGHIANNEFKKVKLSRLETVVIDESLAESFAYWATEEFNKIYSLKFKDIRIILSAEIEEQKIPEKLYQVTEEKIILTKLLLDFHNIFGSSKKTYEKIQDLAYNHPTELAKLIYDCYISNK
ncbi:MAG: hypothetical protein KKF52_00050, partial [Nanoarchaeota archaeon]|nr:hypothetical protein [Nanoarchaeota archaeon]